MGAMGLIRKNEPGIYTLNEWESLTDIRTGTRCNNDSDRHTMRIHGQMYFSVEPLLCGSCPDYRLLPLLHGHVSCNKWSQSSATRNPAYSSDLQGHVPMYLYHANDKNNDEYFSSHHIPVEGLAMERLSVKSKRLH